MSSEAGDAVYWTLFTYKEWNIYLAAVEDGLCYAGVPNEPFEELIRWTQSALPGSALIQADHSMRPYVSEFSAYLQGRRQSFSFPLVLLGTPFQKAVWEALCQIPYGQTQTYSDIARQIGKPTAVRAVGAAIGANPLLMAVPCHRVIGKNGKLTGYRGGLEMKAYLLQMEQKQAHQLNGYS